MCDYLFFSSFSIASSISLFCFSFALFIRFIAIRPNSIDKMNLVQSFSITLANIFNIQNKISICSDFSYIAMQRIMSETNPSQSPSIKQYNVNRTTNKAITNPSPLKNPFFTSSPSFIPSIYKFSGGVI